MKKKGKFQNWLNNLNLKKIIFILLLIVFLPIAIWTLGTGRLTFFFTSALIVYIIMQLCKKYLK